MSISNASLGIISRRQARGVHPRSQTDSRTLRRVRSEEQLPCSRQSVCRPICVRSVTPRLHEDPVNGTSLKMNRVQQTERVAMDSSTALVRFSTHFSIASSSIFQHEIPPPPVLEASPVDFQRMSIARGQKLQPGESLLRGHYREVAGIGGLKRGEP